MSCLVSMDTLFCGYTARMRKTAKEQFQDIEGQAMYSTSVESGETVTTLAYPNYRWVTGYSSTSHMVPGYYLYHDGQQAYHQGCLILAQQFCYGSGISKKIQVFQVLNNFPRLKKKHTVSFKKKICLMITMASIALNNVSEILASTSSPFVLQFRHYSNEASNWYTRLQWSQGTAPGESGKTGTWWSY